MTRTLTQSEFQKRIYNCTNGEIICLEKYKGRRYLHSFRHLKCGRPFLATPDNVYQNKRVCPHCRGRLRSNAFYKRSNKKHIKVRCADKHRFRIKPSEVKNFKKGKIECPICKKLDVLDPLYEGVPVDFSFENRLLINLGLERAAYFKEIL